MGDLRATFLARLRDPRTIPILARHCIPIIGVFVFGWSVLETVASHVPAPSTAMANAPMTPREFAIAATKPQNHHV